MTTRATDIAWGTLRRTRLLVSTFVISLLAACGGGENHDSRMKPLSVASSPVIVEIASDVAPEVLRLVKVSEKRISRTVFEYQFVLDLQTKDIDLYAVQANLVSTGPGTTPVRTALSLGDLDRNRRATSVEAITIRHDRTIPFSTVEWRWAFSAFDPIPTASPVVEWFESAPGVEIAKGELLINATESANHFELVRQLRDLGWTVVGHSAIRKAYQVRLPGAIGASDLEAAALAIRGNPMVAGVSVNPIFRSSSYPVPDPIAAPGAATKESNWPFFAIDAYSAWSDVYGAKSESSIPSVRVAVVDEWFEAGEPDLSKMTGSDVWPWYGVPPPGTKLYHGNFVAGILGASSDSFLTLGVAHKGTTIAGYPLLRPLLGMRDYANIMNKIETATRDGAKVLNLSMGVSSVYLGYCTVVPDLYRVMNAFGWGTLYVQASGNDGLLGEFAEDASIFGRAVTLGSAASGCGLPVSFEEATKAIRKRTIVVGAVGPDAGFTLTAESLERPGYSSIPRNLGTVAVGTDGSIGDDFYPFILAPGGGAHGWVYSNARPTDERGLGDKGTSYAAPHVAGVAALVLQSNPGLSADRVRDVILLSATQRCSDGYLVLNAARAVELARLPGLAKAPACLAPAVSSVACSTPIVGASMTCTVSGANLPATTTFTATNCSPGTMAAVAGSTPSARAYACVPQVADVAVDVSYSVPGFIGPLPGVVSRTAESAVASRFVWPVAPAVTSRGHQGPCEDQSAPGCFWLSDASEDAAAVWRDSQPFQQQANYGVAADGSARWHLGADYNLGSGDSELAGTGSLVYAAATGQVAETYTNACGFGNVLMLRHTTPTETVVTMYAHVDWIDGKPPERDAWFVVGSPIARVGKGVWTASTSCASSGSYSAHLHFELRRSSDSSTGSAYTTSKLLSGTLGPQGQTDPNAYIRDRLTAGATLSTHLFDDFNGTSVNTAIWNPIIGIPGYTYTVSGGTVTFQRATSFSTSGISSISSSRIVIEGVGGGREVTFALFDVDTPTWTHAIFMSNTAYRGWGTHIQSRGDFLFFDGIEGGQVAPSFNYDPAMLYYRMTIEGDRVVVERGTAPDNITLRVERQMRSSIIGRRFYFAISSGGGIEYSPGTFDWVKVQTSP